MAVKRHRTHFDVTAQDGTKQAFDSVERNLRRTKDAASSMGQTFRAVLGATVFAGLTRESGMAAMEAEKAQSRLTAVLRATGGAAGVTRREIDALADSLAENTLFDDEAFRSAAGELVKFGNIHGNVFREALALAADLASFMGTDVPAAAQMIGRSLQSPTEGLRMMEREFGKLTEAEEKHINTLVEQGRALEAQQAVLELYRRKVGGVAQEMNTGLTGAWAGAKKAANELLEALGAQGTRLNRTFGGATQLMKDIKSEMEGVRTPLRGLLEDTVGWLAHLRGVPGVIGNIGQAIHDAREKARLTASGRIKGTTTLAEAQQQQTDLEASIAAGQTSIQLGGKTTDSEEQKRREAFILRQQAEGQEELNRMRREYVEHLAGQEKKAFEERAKAEQKVIDGINEHNLRVEELGQNTVIFTNAAGEKVFMLKDHWELVTDAERRAKEAAQDLGFTFSSAFEDAIVGGKELSEILKGLEQDIARIVIRKAITEPLAAGITAALPFGGKRAAGGPVSAGSAYLVGEEGPELFVPGRSGSIAPNGAGNTYIIDARGADMAAVARIERSLIALAGPGVVERRAISAQRELRRR